MCGIVGIYDSRARRPIDRDLLHRMNESQHHRGPDGGGLHMEAGIGLGHRRLAIIDLASGQQPLANEDGSVVVVANGEIYNFEDLRHELTAVGHTFRTRSDTEVIVHAWEAWGSACVDRFRGMFAFALWDRNHETLFLARDRLGVKPLHYATLPDGRWLFGSELKSLLVHPDLRRTVDPLAVEDYFAFGYVPEPRTILREVRKLAPGHTLTVRRGEPGAAPRQYWDVPFAPVGPLTGEEAAEELVHRLRESVRLRLVADVPVGAFLSGGVDSSAVVALMAGLTSQPVVTRSIGFADPTYDESPYAQAVASRYGTDHDAERVDHSDAGLVDRLASAYDEPYADSSAVPTYRLSALARKTVAVALSGDGGDEAFGGYRRYRSFQHEARVRSAVPHGLRRPVFGLLGRHYPRAGRAPRVLRAKSTFEALARDPVDAYFHGVSILRDESRRALFSEAFRRELQGYGAVEVLRAHAARAPSDHPLSLAQYLDFKTYLVGDINTKVDRASMAHSLEVREPLMDHPLVEWASGLPPRLRVRRGEGKHVLKRAMAPYLPDAILSRPKKGFSVPLAAWLRGPLRPQVEAAVLGPVLRDIGWFDGAYLRELVESHQSGRRDHSAPLWSLLLFESFLRRVAPCA